MRGVIHTFKGAYIFVRTVFNFHIDANFVFDRTLLSCDKKESVSRPVVRPTHRGSSTAYLGSVENQWGYAYSMAMRKRKNFLSATPLRFALNNLIFALKDSAIALDALLL